MKHTNPVDVYLQPFKLFAQRALQCQRLRSKSALCEKFIIFQKTIQTMQTIKLHHLLGGIFFSLLFVSLIACGESAAEREARKVREAHIAAEITAESGEGLYYAYHSTDHQLVVTVDGDTAVIRQFIRYPTDESNPNGRYEYNLRLHYKNRIYAFLWQLYPEDGKRGGDRDAGAYYRGDFAADIAVNAREGERAKWAHPKEKFQITFLEGTGPYEADDEIQFEIIKLE